MSHESIITQALRVAAVQYAIDAETSRDQPRLRETFYAQARQANDLADAIEARGYAGVIDGHTFSLAEIRNGTGWSRDARFLLMPREQLLGDTTTDAGEPVTVYTLPDGTLTAR